MPRTNRIVRENTNANRLIAVLVILVLVLLGIALIVGIVVSMVWLVASIRHLDWSPVGNMVVALAMLFTDVDQHNVRTISIEKVSVLLTALATLMLFVATRQLKTATHRQVAGDAPVLQIDVMLLAALPSSTTKSRVEPYSKSLREQDEELFAGARLTPERYLCIKVLNLQNEPFAPARDIKVDVQIRSHDLPASALPPEVQGLPLELLPKVSPYIVRSVSIPVLGAGRAELHPICNVAALSELEAAV